MFGKVLLFGSVGAYASGLAYCKYTTGVCKSTRNLNGQTVIVTGGNTGIGLETARDLAARNARVILACRDRYRGEKAMQDILTTTGNPNILVKEVDLSSFESVRTFAKDILENEKRIDVLINNAGALFEGDQKSVDGIELTMATNHYGPFLLTNLLLPLMKENKPSRIVVVSSMIYVNSKLDLDELESGKVSKKKFDMYGKSKLANVLFTRELSERLKGTGVTVNTLHPGVIKTDFFRNLSTGWHLLLNVVIGPFFKDCKQGAQTTIHVAVSEELEGVSGKYFADCKEKKLKEHAMDENTAKRLWEHSEKVTKSAQV